jgi:hypothetical protein
MKEPQWKRILVQPYVFCILRWKDSLMCLDSEMLEYIDVSYKKFGPYCILGCHITNN